MVDTPSIVALVATRYRAPLLTRLLHSLAAQSLRPTAAVICDNGPRPRYRRRGKKFSSPISLPFFRKKPRLWWRPGPSRPTRDRKIPLYDSPPDC